MHAPTDTIDPIPQGIPVQVASVSPPPDSGERRALDRFTQREARRYLRLYVSPKDLPRAPKGPRPVLFYRDRFGNTDIEIPPTMKWAAVETLGSQIGLVQLTRKERRALARARS